MLHWILCVALFAGASSASQIDAGYEVQQSTDTVLEAFPSVVQIEVYFFWSNMAWSQQCAGSVVTSRFVLSAASCFTGWTYEPRFRRVRAGSSSRDTGGLVIYVLDRINNPSWYEHTYSGDVALVRLMTALVYSPLIQQATIAAPGSVISINLRLSQLGWGQYEQPLLSSSQMVVANRVSCGRRDGNFSNVLNVTENILCALHVANVTTNYDVGSPWFFNDITVGVVGGINDLQVYSGLIAADIPKYTEWIVNTVAGGFF